MNMFGADKALCFKVDVEIKRPLLRGIKIMIEGRPRWIYFKFVKLPDFCYGCGCLGHVLKDCDYVDPDTPSEELQRNAEEEIQEERKLLLAYRSSKQGPKARSHLTFDDSSTPRQDPGPAKMAIDVNETITPGNKVFKWKLEGDGPEMEKVRMELGNFYGAYAEARGRAGALALLWDKTMTLNLLSCSSHYMDVSLQLGEQEPTWRFTGVYGWAEMGDLNEIFYHSEKKGRPPKPQSHIDSFCDAFIECGLFDISFLGYEYTWCNYHEISIEWSIMFPEAAVHHIDYEGSNHLPIMLKTRPNRRRTRNHGNSFKFEYMWVTNPTCPDIIAKAWQQSRKEDCVENLVTKLEECCKELSNWNREHFGNVTKEIQWLEQRLRVQTDAISQRETLDNIREWKQKEEILWWYGDSNTISFHSRASMRRAYNSIDNLEDENGDLQSEPTKLENILIWHFSPKSLFTVRSAYNAIVNDRNHQQGSSSGANDHTWKLI
ncbi:hypothetical protein Cgig2_018972 [Carnegiea gigantea]|uniref:CCHC-type domain-containing protein n=1 Tax=Carnegiea gigantea TaxID=171969 RepID=A0A9Q1K260_9CARY|nr:hypothetical protein Cgig2_018972 [Carnegiea gigantea]